MSHVNTIQRSSQTYSYEELQQAMQNGSIDSSKVTDVSVFTQSADSSACTDGKDDGKIGFFSALGSTIKGAVKGVVNGIKGMFTDENGNFSLGKTLKSALTVGACFIPGVGPFIAGGLCAYGAVKGTVGIAKGVAAAANATTDAEKKAAFESIGANGVATAASVVGLKGSVNAIAGNVAKAGGTATKALGENAGTLAKVKAIGSDVASSFRGIKGTGVTGFKGALSDAANTLTGNYYSGVWSTTSGSTVSRIGQTIKQTGTDTAANIYEVYNNTKNAIKEKTSKFNKKSDTKTADSVTKDPTGLTKTKTSTKKVSDLPEGIQKSIESGNKSGQIDGNTTYEVIGNGKVKITTNTKTLKGYTNDLKNYTEMRNTFDNGTIGYQGTTGKTAAIGTVANSIGNTADDMTNSIPYASQTFATVNTQTGRGFDLEDYTITGPNSINYSTLIR